MHIFVPSYYPIVTLLGIFDLLKTQKVHVRNGTYDASEKVQLQMLKKTDAQKS